MVVRKICILGLEDYPMLMGANGCIGGESVQHVLLARAWRDLGLDVSIVVYDHGQPRIQMIDGIRVVAAYRRDAGLRYIRFFHPRISSVVRAMREVDADVYYQSPSGAFTGVVAWFAKRHGKFSIIRIASDLGCMRGRQLMRHARDRQFYDYGLRHASLIAAQTAHQRALLRRHYAVRSEVVNIAAEIPPERVAPAKDIDVLWIGNLRPVKRPEWVLDLAQRMPRYRFTMAGGPLPGQGSYYERFLQQAAGVPNVQLLGPVPYGDTAALFARARIHLNTSSIEGFPNTFLQAWVRGVPVVSHFDPDGLIAQRELGRTAADPAEMGQAIDALLRDPARCAEIGERARAFASAQFSAQQLARRYLELIQASLQSRASLARIESAAASGGR